MKLTLTQQGRRYDLDGLDIDIEGELMMRIDAAGNYTPFVRELATALHARSKLLTAATGSYPGGMVPDASLPYFDLLGIMSYDQVGPTWGSYISRLDADATYLGRLESSGRDALRDAAVGIRQHQARQSPTWPCGSARVCRRASSHWACHSTAAASALTAKAGACRTSRRSSAKRN